MRANAIIRILIWSIVILVLIGILIAGLGFGLFFRNITTDTMEESSILITSPTERPVEVQAEPVPEATPQTTVRVLSSANIYSSPSEESTVKATLDAGQNITFFRQEQINGQNWVYTTYGEGGWIPAELLDMERATNAILLTSAQVKESPQEDAPSLALLTEGTQIYVEKTESIADGNWAYLTYPEKGWVLADTLQTDLPTNATTKNQSILRESPSRESGMLAQLEAGVNVRIEEVRGTEWAFLSRPESGWVPMEDLEVTDSIVMDSAEPSPSAPTLPLKATGETMIYEADKITSIGIDWVAGNIILEPGDSDQILLWQEGNTDEKYAMEVWSNRGKLNISFCEESLLKGFHVGIGKNLTKDLVIQLPRDWAGKELEIDAASANLEVYSQTFQEVEIDTASGTCLFENCTIQEMDLDSASGDVEFSGSLHSLEFDAASASFTGTLTNVPSYIDMDSMSGSLCLTLPADAGFSVKLDGMSKDFSSDFPTTQKGGRYVCGDERCRIDVDAMNGNVQIWQSKPAA